MKVSFTCHPDDAADTDFFMAVASREEWEEVARSLDGVGHSPAAMALLRGLEGWGIRK